MYKWMLYWKIEDLGAFWRVYDSLDEACSFWKSGRELMRVWFPLWNENEFDLWIAV